MAVNPLEEKNVVTTGTTDIYLFGKTIELNNTPPSELMVYKPCVENQSGISKSKIIISATSDKTNGKITISPSTSLTSSIISTVSFEYTDSADTQLIQTQSVTLPSNSSSDKLINNISNYKSNLRIIAFLIDKSSDTQSLYSSKIIN